MLDNHQVHQCSYSVSWQFFLLSYNPTRFVLWQGEKTMTRKAYSLANIGSKSHRTPAEHDQIIGACRNPLDIALSATKKFLFARNIVKLLACSLNYLHCGRLISVCFCTILCSSVQLCTALCNFCNSGQGHDFVQGTNLSRSYKQL